MLAKVYPPSELFQTLSRDKRVIIIHPFSPYPQHILQSLLPQAPYVILAPNVGDPKLWIHELSRQLIFGDFTVMLPPPDAALQEQIMAIANAVIAKAPSDLWVFCSDFDQTPQKDTEFQRFIQDLIAMLPPQVRFIIQGRDELLPDLWKSPLEQGQAIVLGWEFRPHQGRFSHNPQQPHSLEVYGFGSGRVFLNGREVKALYSELHHQLFFFILEHWHQTGGVSKEAILQTFWGTSTQQVAQANFASARTAISKAFAETLGLDSPLPWLKPANHLYHFHPDLAVYYDVKDFFTQSKALEQRHNGMISHQERVERILAALHLYGDQFFSHLDQSSTPEWVKTARQNYLRPYVDLLRDASDWFRQNRAFDQEQRYLFHMIRIQPSYEKPYERLILYYRLQNDLERAKEIDQLAKTNFARFDPPLTPPDYSHLLVP